jgi:hypothetical protein
MDCLNSQTLEVVMKIMGLRWAGCVIRVSNSAMQARIMMCNTEGKGRLGRPKARKFDAVDNDVGKRAINWRIEDKVRD